VTSMRQQRAADKAAAEKLSREAVKARADMDARCKAAGLAFEDVVNPERGSTVKVGMRCGRDVRSILLVADRDVVAFSSVQFEKYSFLYGFNAFCSYSDGVIEAAIHSSEGTLGGGLMPWGPRYRRLFGIEGPTVIGGSPDHRLTLEPPQAGFPTIEISSCSQTFKKLMVSRYLPMTLKLTGCKIDTHDQATALLKKVAGATFFQVDLMSNISLTLVRASKRHATDGGTRKSDNVAGDLQYPKTEFDDAPLSLYSYGRGASGMPLLQFLAFYQVMEFYFPIYSKAEAQRRLRSILKDPAFRGDRDADIARLLSAIHISRGGGYGDEKSQLRATVMECVEPEALRNFLESDPELRDFYSSGSKDSAYHRVPLTNPALDLRADVAERMYDIRCKIVHTKNDGRDGEGELLLPYSKEADQLHFDIRLARYLAQSTLIAGSTPFQIGV
jgi:hypothetical protein